MDRSTPSVAGNSTYFQEIASYPLLSAEEEIELAKQIEAGREASRRLASETLSELDHARLQRVVEAGVQARQRFIECNLRLVVTVAKKHLGRGLSLMDLVQEGSIGLQTAVDKYDWRQGFRFSTYGWFWIRQAMVRAIQSQSRAIRLPPGVLEQVRQVATASNALQQELGRQPKITDIAGRLGVEPQRVRDLVHWSRQTASLDTLLGNEEPCTTLGARVHDRITPAPVDAAEHAVLSQCVEEAMATLSPRERQVLRLRFGLVDHQEHSLKGIAKQLGISGERVRQIEQTALTKLRQRTHLHDQVAEYVAA